ncbi:MAG: hypothetical protein SGI77_08250 [Pirellulaceae bacterium]|nr:hypothetical protein [Pirellulaceae bacterium]
MSGATGDLTLSELRNSHIAGEVAIDSGFSRIFSLICPAVAFILFETTRRSLNPRWLAFTFFLLGSMLLVSVSSFGARYDVLCGVCFTLTIFVAHYSAFISRIPKSAAVFAVVISFIILAFVNARFAAVRSTEGLGEDAMDVFYETGVEITRTIGFKKSNYTIALTIGMVDEYLLHTIERFGMYLEKDRLEPAWGQHSFSLLTRRIGFNDGPRFKQAVDELYYPFGIENNIWATAFREFCIDFKLLGTIAFCAALGILYRLCQTKFFYSWFANFLAAYIATIFLLAPVSSIFKSLYFQAAFLSAVLLLAIDVMFGNVVTAWICERSEIEYDKLDEH